MSTLKIKRENGKIFCPLADSWHIETPEEKVRQEYIKILVEDYGYSLDQMAQEIKVNNSQRGQGKARADIVIYEKALKQVNDNIGKSLLSLYDVGSMSGLTEVLFMERCLRLLKKGGRMGMVLPEGVLNTSNLQKIREYFEGKAKIILICSIPQDVFIAAGATVKPSLVFFKRFTEEEELQYLGAKTRAEKEIRQKYIGQIKALQEKIVEEKSKKLKVKALIAAAEKELPLVFSVLKI